MHPIIEQAIKPFTPRVDEHIKAIDTVTDMLKKLPQDRRVQDARILLCELKVDELFKEES
jgi:hypothetical protein